MCDQYTKRIEHYEYDAFGEKDWSNQITLHSRLGNNIKPEYPVTVQKNN